MPAPNTKLGNAIFARAIFVFIWPNNNPPVARVISPRVHTGFIPNLITNIPLRNEAIKHPKPRGSIDKPLKNDV